METGLTNQILGGFRLSPQQRRLWRLASQPAGGPSPYRSLCAIRIEGEVDEAALAAALAAVSARHEILRTAFRRLPGMSVPLQIVDGATPPALEIRDLRGLPPAEREAALADLLAETGRQPFDLANGPLLRLCLARLAAGRSVLFLSASALCADGPGLRRILREIAAAAAGAPPEEDALQYADLAEWQNGLLESEDSAPDRETWRRRDLAALSARLSFEVRAPDRRPFETRTVAVELPRELTAAVARLAECSGVEIETVLLAAWAVLLARSSGQAEVVIGAVADGRSYDGLESAPGPLARALPLPLAVDDRPVQQLLSQVSRDLGEAREAQEYFSWELAPETTEGDIRFTSFGFDCSAPLEELSLGGAKMMAFRESACVDRSTVCLVALWGAVRQVLEIRYDAGRVERKDALRLAEQLPALLRRMTVAGTRPVSELEVLGEAERQQLLHEAGSARRGDPGPPFVHRRFERWASEAPSRPAVVWEEQTLSYGELNARANRLAHRLRGLEVGLEDRVALCLERSHEMVVALLGTLKAEAAYLPLDPSQPPRRLASILDQSGVRVLVTQRTLAPLFQGLDVAMLCLDGDGGELARCSPENPGGSTPPESLAYVLFTSGSTGVPKGVGVEHRQLANYVDGAVERLDLPPGGSFATVSTFAADLGNTMIFPALCTGGCLHVIASDRVSDPERLAEYAASHDIDCLKLVPSHLAALLSASRPERVLPRRRLVFGGESLPWELAGRVRALRPECELFNHYGPTETTVGAIAGRVPGERRPELASVPLGRPLADTQVYLLDGGLRPVPTWAAGELYVGGAGLARGYLGRPDSTADRFIPNPYGGPGERLYRTGDLARWLPDGGIEFLGRADGQVKIRGFRIETGEIEALLRHHPQVREAVTLARRDDGGELRLVAYVVPDRQQAPSPEELRRHLAERLPEAMVPAAFVMLKALPLTPNGKVDRGALPAPGSVRPELAASYAPPRTEMERAVAAIWQEVLRLERVGIHDNFFDLGGHSLLLVQVSVRLRQAFQREIPMVDLFQRTTISSLVSYLGDRPAEAVPAPDEEVERAGARREALQRQRQRRLSATAE